VKRFYTDVSVTLDRGIALDNRRVRTPAKADLILPTAALAEAVAAEWRAQEREIKPQTMPLTGLANAAIDHVVPNAEPFAAGLAAYGETDLLYYRADEQIELRVRQDMAWDPVLDWAQHRFDICFTIVSGIMHQPQPRLTVDRLARAVTAYAPFQLAALNPLVTISGSLIVALAVVEREISAEAGFDTAHLDELWQAEQWGEDHFALETRAAHRSDFLAAARFSTLLE
jgi:chaperone required for assembly of F1-ATPase